MKDIFKRSLFLYSLIFIWMFFLPFGFLVEFILIPFSIMCAIWHESKVPGLLKDKVLMYSLPLVILYFLGLIYFNLPSSLKVEKNISLEKNAHMAVLELEYLDVVRFEEEYLETDEPRTKSPWKDITKLLSLLPILWSLPSDSVLLSHSLKYPNLAADEGCMCAWYSFKSEDYRWQATLFSSQKVEYVAFNDQKEKAYQASLKGEKEFLLFLKSYLAKKDVKYLTLTKREGFSVSIKTYDLKTLELLKDIRLKSYNLISSQSHGSRANLETWRRLVAFIFPASWSRANPLYKITN